MVHVSLMFLSEWREFPSAPGLAGGKKTRQLASWCCWNRARRLTCFLSSSVTRKDLQFGTWTDPSFQRHYGFRPTTSGSRSVSGLISTPSYFWWWRRCIGKDMEDVILLVEHCISTHLQRIQLVYVTWSVLQCLEMCTCIWGHPEAQILLHVELESAMCWTMVLVSYSAPRTLRRCTKVLCSSLQIWRLCK